MGKIIVVLLAIVVLAIAFTAIGKAEDAQAKENYVWYLPIFYKNYTPHQYGCIEPDSAECRSGPPFSIVP